ncbi:MAG: DUF349 domain-containing protein [Kangiellaceae bacterium]|nr:DUF349 domain-containing protein [Kangiellaceae bacterium]
MFKSLFTPKWKHTDPLVRAQAVNDLDPISDISILTQLVLSEPQADIRKTVLGKIEQVRDLQPLLNQAESPILWIELAARISQLQSDNSQALAVQFNQRSGSWPQPQVIEAISYCDSAVLANTIVQNLDNESLLDSLVRKTKILDTKLLALEKIQSPDLLQKLVKDVSHKQVLQRAKEKLGAIKLIEKQRLDNKEQAQKICVALERLVKQTWDTQFNAKVEVQQRNWQSLETTYIDEFESRYRLALANCVQLIESKQAELAAVQHDAEVHSQQSELYRQLESLIEELENEQLDTIKPTEEAFQLIESTWARSTEDVEPKAEVKAQFVIATDKLKRYFSAWLDLEQQREVFSNLTSQPPADSVNELSEQLSELRKMQKQLGWLSDLAKPNILVEVKKHESDILKKIDAYEGEQKKKSAHLNHKLTALKKHISQKNLIAANKLLNYINFEKEQLSGKFLSTMESKVQSLLEQLDELRDWHAFATTPKKEALVKSMQALSEKQHSPLELAEKIHQLQEEWHELISSDAQADHLLWDQFKSASDLAYKPCLTYYAEQDKIKADNLESKLKICEELDQFINSTDWNGDSHDNDFWKSLDKKYSQVTKQWKQFEPIPQNERKRVQNRFNQLLKAIKSHLQSLKEGNLELRQDLTKKAIKLAQQEDVRAAVDNAKQLQQDWKQLGITFYKADKEEWKNFRKALDQVFNRRDEEKQAFKSKLTSNKELLLELINKINALSALEDKQLKKTSQEYNGVIEQFDKSMELPRKDAKDLLRKYEQAQNNYQTAFQGISQRQRVREIKSILDFDLQLHQLEQKRTSGGLEGIEQIAEALSELNCSSNIRDILRKRIDLSQQAPSIESDAELNRILLDAEIALGISSPGEFKQERMTRQLEILEKGIGTAS